MSTSLELSEDEYRVLRLFDRLQELQYQLALAHAEADHPQDEELRGSEQQLGQAREQLLTSKGAYDLRNKAVSSVVMVNPILQAVHRGSNASPLERDLLSLVGRRDILAGEIATQSHVHRGVVGRLTQIEVDLCQTSRQNVALAAETARLASEINKATETNSVVDLRLEAEATKVEDEFKQNVRMRQMVKETTSAIITGSGIDWTRDQHLRNMVLNPD